jgi:hypothetical protein
MTVRERMLTGALVLTSGLEVAMRSFMQSTLSNIAATCAGCPSVSMVGLTLQLSPSKVPSICAHRVRLCSQAAHAVPTSLGCTLSASAAESDAWPLACFPSPKNDWMTLVVF